MSASGGYEPDERLPIPIGAPPHYIGLILIYKIRFDSIRLLALCLNGGANIYFVSLLTKFIFNGAQSGLCQHYR